MTSPAPSFRPRWLSGKLILALALGVALLIGLAAWANALTEPVVRAGVPTTTVTPPPPKPKPAPKPTPSASPSPSGKPSSAKPSASAKPSKSAKPSAKPSKEPTFTTSSIKQASASGTGNQHTFIVKVQGSTGLKANDVAKQIAGVLNDPRSWAGKGTVRFALVKDAKQADFTVYVADPKVVNGKCGSADWVCVRGGKLALGATGWKDGAATYQGDLEGFRRYLVNHAVGLHLGEKKASCKAKGKTAPVMAPQADDLKGCKPNPWPYP